MDLSEYLGAVLRDAIEHRKLPTSGKVVSISGGAQPSDAHTLGPWLFFPELGEKPTRQDVQRVYKSALRAMRRSLEKAGMPAHFGLHGLRHTYGSGLISQGVSPAYVQAQMGHASIQQTVDTYGSWFPPRFPGAVDALARTLALGRGHQMDTGMRLEAAKGR